MTMHRTAAVLGFALLAGTPTLASGQLSDRIQLHGFLNQGYGATTGDRVMGLTQDASAKYRNGVLLFRGNVTQQTDLVLQLNNELMGTAGHGAPVAVNWLFGVHRFANGVTLKAGKLPMPRGIYNEIRSSGTLLPFYRAPILSYSEGYETIKGVSASRSFLQERSWNIDATLYGGNWESETQSYSSRTPLVRDVGTSLFDHTWGSQLWLNSPVDGLRFGLAGLGYHSNGKRITRDSIVPSRAPDRRAVVVSLDGDFERFMVRSELRHQWYLGDATSPRNYYYAQGALKLRHGISLNVQGEEKSRTRYASATDSTLVSSTDNKDMALGVRWMATPTMALKLERHWAYGRNVDRFVPRGEATPRVAYSLLSATVAF